MLNANKKEDKIGIVVMKEVMKNQGYTEINSESSDPLKVMTP